MTETDNQNSWLSNIKSSIKTQTTTWLVAFVIAIMGLFSSQITEKVKFALNRADLRTKQYEELVTEVSQYLFAAELVTEFIEHDWTTKTAMTTLITDYNTSIKTLRKKEFVFQAWIRKYWGRNEATQFASFMKSVREFDSAGHSLNDEYEAVNITGSKPKIDRKRAEDALKIMQPAIDNMHKQSHALMAAIEE